MASRKDIPTLRIVVVVLGFAILGRILWDPRIMGTDVGSTPIFNWLLFGYGAPAAAFWYASRLLRRRREDLASHICDALAVIFTTLLGVFQIRHFVYGGDPLHAGSSHLETGLQAVFFLGLSHGLMHLARARGTPVFGIAQAACAALAGLVIVFGLVIGNNPFITNEAIGGGVPLSTLVPAYLLQGWRHFTSARHAAPYKEGLVYLGRCGRGTRFDLHLDARSTACVLGGAHRPGSKASRRLKCG